MPEATFSMHPSIPGKLTQLDSTGAAIFWGILERAFSDGRGPIMLPKKIWVDARKLVKVGIAREEKEGSFELIPHLFESGSEPTIAELTAAAP